MQKVKLQQKEWIPLKTAIERTGLNRPKLRRLVEKYRIPTKTNARDLRERLVNYQVLKRLLEE